ncbi:MAG: YggU family protein [Deltaproteobacteria bacterium]|nr:YggU family protein [Deltaproteobacteria bacterium]
MALRITEDGDGVTFEVRVVPRASRTAVAGEHDGALKVAIAAPPVDGAANAALVAWLADALDVPKRAVSIVRGETGRSKVVRVLGTTSDAVIALAQG